MNASKALQGTTMGCFQSNGDAASVIVIYPKGTPNLTVAYVPACLALVEGSREFLVSDSFVNLLEDWTGTWKLAASYFRQLNRTNRLGPAVGLNRSGGLRSAY